MNKKNFQRFGFIIILITALNVFLFDPKTYAETQTKDSINSSEKQQVIEENPEVPETQNEAMQNERTELEKQLKDLEEQIAEQQGKIKTYGTQKKTLQNEINLLDSKIKKINLEIKAINLNVGKVNQNIVDTQKQINNTENRIEIHKEAISKALRLLNETDRISLVAILVANKNFSDFIGTVNNITLIQQSLKVALADITKLRQNLIGQKEELSLQKKDAEDLKNAQESQKKNAQVTQNSKTSLLKTTKGKETEYQKLLKKTQESAAQIRTRIFELLGGGELTFEKAYDYAKLAEGVTGVRAALILAVLHRESLLGKNTGQCQYNAIQSSSGKTTMRASEITVFLSILKKLNIDPESTFAKVSCPNSDGTYGGAMGPAQFMPSTWKLYEDDIAKITNNNPPNPWNNSDAFVATGLYLQNFGAAQKTATSEKKAAAIYYCGSNWQRYACTYYAGKVVESANNFQKDIDILNQTTRA